MGNKKELLKKLKALAEAGIDGEKVNAEKMLKQLMKKYNITDRDIETPETKTFYFSLSNNKLYKKLFFQIAAQVGVRSFRRTNKRFKIAIELDAATQIELLARYAFYLECFKKELNTFFIGFVMKNELWPKEESDGDSKVSEEELLEYSKAGKMASGINKYQYETDKLGQLALDFENL